MENIKAYAADKAGGVLKPFEYKVGDLGPEEVDIKVHYCGICHSDLSMLDNAWQMTTYPFVPGHEVIGEIVGLGERVGHLSVGQTIGLGWYSKSCMHCSSCLGGHHNLCAGVEGTVVGRHGGFADRVRCHWSWAVPVPEGTNPATAGPMFCGGITVFNPIVEFGVSPTDRVGVIGIGGLGHIALKFLNKWGCHVTAFTSSPAKAEEARKFGAHEIVDSTDDGALEKIAGSLDFLLVTANVTLNWPLYINTLGPKGRLHFVGAVLEPVGVPVFSLLTGQREISASPLGSPALTRQMLDFSARHGIEPQTEEFPMSKVNDALDHLRAGKARYRIVLKNDF